MTRHHPPPTHPPNKLNVRNISAVPDQTLKVGFWDQQNNNVNMNNNNNKSKHNISTINDQILTKL